MKILLLLALQAGYFETLDRPDGGYGWEDEPTGHLTPTYAAVAALRLLGGEVPRAAERAAFARKHHPYRGPEAESRRHAAEIKTFVWQQIRIHQLLGMDPSPFLEEVRAWPAPSRYLANYESDANPLFQQEVTGLLCRELLGLPPSGLLEYVLQRRRPDGSFNNAPGEGPGHVLTTWFGLQALRIYGRLDRREETIAWLRACQLPGGGFTWSPGAEAGALDGVDSTWAAVSSLALLDAGPSDPEAALRYLRSLANADGGFGPRPRRRSDPSSTLRALETLKALGAPLEVPLPPAPAEAALPEGLRVWTIQLQAPGTGSPEDAVEIARALGIHLWGAKNSPPGWIAAASAAAERRKAPVRFFACNEEYGTFVELPGFGAYSHVADLMAPGGDFGASLAGAPVSWEDFRARRLAPLERAGGRLVWQLCDNEEYATVLLDDSLQRGGYAVLSAFHMKQNFVDILPFSMRYRGALPFVSLQDAHGREPWSWVDDLAGYRTLFLAKEPTWEGWLEALRRDWVVAVRQDENTRGRARALGGTPAARRALLAAPWRVERPLAALAVVRSGDVFEHVRPAEGAAIRVRTAWSNSPGGVLQKPLATLEALTLDGRELPTRRVEARDAKGGLLDEAHLADLPAGSGPRTAAARVRTPDGRRVQAILELD
jgi:hypothetical protein